MAADEATCPIHPCRATMMGEDPHVQIKGLGLLQTLTSFCFRLA